MSNTGHQSPLGINVSGSALQNIGLTINPVATGLIGSSKTNSSYTPGTIIENTCLKWLTYAIQEAYNQTVSTPGTPSNTTYDALISIGATTIPALGNAKPPTYTTTDPAGTWTGVATTGYYLASDPGAAQGQSQGATWIPYTTVNTNKSVTQWGFIRLYALQAWNEFNWNGIPAAGGMPEYKDFTQSFTNVLTFIETANNSIRAAQDSLTFGQGTYSSMNDLMSGNVTGVNLATFQFGQDCVTAGKVIDLSKIARFGYPSVLLQSIRKYNALTQALALALLSTGISGQDLDNIATGTTIASKVQEQQLYGAFLVIAGNDLRDILIPLNCKTAGLTSLADLLNIKMLFPGSYESMTVPIYNTIPGPTNSKTYYPIFENGAVSSRLTTPAIRAQIGTIIVPGAPVTSDTNATNSNFQVQPGGFGVSLYNILPDDIATSAGAFAYSMQQVSNISSIDFEKFAQVTYNLESTKGLNLIGGTDTPTDTALAQSIIDNTAFGSGVGGTYTVSDFFGCMSGLPYLWNDITAGVSNLASAYLIQRYQFLYLACAWERATVTVNYTGTGPYQATTVTVVNPGGGYGREQGQLPTFTSTGGTGVCVIGTDPNDLSTYGKLISVTFTPGAPIGSPPTGTIGYPPSEAYLAAGGAPNEGSLITTESGLILEAEGMTVYPEAEILEYISEANAEIVAIQAANVNMSRGLILAYELAGTQLNMEQRSRFNAIEAVPSPTRDTTLSQYPASIFSFIDFIPFLAGLTDPHMYAQTLEAISDLNTIGGESIIAMMRQARNNSRLQEIGISQDNNIPDTLNGKVQTLLVANGTAPGAQSGITVYGINGTSSGTVFAIPSNLLQTDSNGNQVAPRPMGFFNPNNESYCLTGGSTVPGQISPIQEILASGQNNVNNTNLLGPSLNGTGPEIADPIIVIRAGASLPVGPCIQDLDTGRAAEPGSLAGSASSNLIPIPLNTAYTSATLLPSIFTVSEAIEAVIQHNCDCWID